APACNILPVLSRTTAINTASDPPAPSAAGGRDAAAFEHSANGGLDPCRPAGRRQARPPAFAAVHAGCAFRSFRWGRRTDRVRGGGQRCILRGRSRLLLAL